MEHIGTEISTQAARGIETYFESEVFQPLERERDEVQSMLKQLETDRRTNLADRTAKVSRSRCRHRVPPKAGGMTQATSP